MEFQIPFEGDKCYYCGEPATSIDHVIPQCLTGKFEGLGDANVKKILYDRHKIKKVSACKECNCLLGPKYFGTLDQRKKYLKHRAFI